MNYSNVASSLGLLTISFVKSSIAHLERLIWERDKQVLKMVVIGLIEKSPIVQKTMLPVAFSSLETSMTTWLNLLVGRCVEYGRDDSSGTITIRAPHSFSSCYSLTLFTSNILGILHSIPILKKKTLWVKYEFQLVASHLWSKGVTFMAGS